ncbi:MAG TPA: ABC transporter substrate-binding protein, partial [Bacillaceae bacterium]
MKKKIWGFVLIVAAMLALSACSSNNEKSSGKKENDKVVDIALDQNFVTLDPHNAGDTVSIMGTRAMYEGLVGFDKDMNVVPVLAEKYEVSEDALTYTFKLREGVTFHDGEPFNAEAVKANYDRIMDDSKNLRAKRNFLYVESMEVVSDYEVKFKLNQPFSAMLNKFAMVLMVSPKAISDESKDLAMNPVGTGQFKFSKWNQGDSLELVKYDEYWDKDSSNVEKVVFKPVPENGSRTAMLKTGEADFVYPVPQQSVKDFKENKNVKIKETQSTIARYVSINTFKEPFNNEKVRKAMNYAVNKDAYMKVV